MRPDDSKLKMKEMNWMLVKSLFLHLEMTDCTISRRKEIIKTKIIKKP